MSEEEFWTRYFFRVHQINQEDERRKAVLEGVFSYLVMSASVLIPDDIINAAGSTAQDEDFSWEDEEEDVGPRGEPSPRLASAARELSHDRLMAAVTSGTTSPERSEDSYDLVSSGRASATGDASAAHSHVKEVSDDDSDEEEDDEDDEESAESDWE